MTEDLKDAIENLEIALSSTRAYFETQAEATSRVRGTSVSYSPLLSTIYTAQDSLKKIKEQLNEA